MLRGFSCRSSEFPFAQRTPLRLLIAAWTRAGYCTFRVEKPGVGDSEGPPCPDNDFAAELAGARARGRGSSTCAASASSTPGGSRCSGTASAG